MRQVVAQRKTLEHFALGHRVCSADQAPYEYAAAPGYSELSVRRNELKAHVRWHIGDEGTLSRSTDVVRSPPV